MDYIYEIFKQNKIIELEKALEKEYFPHIKAVVFMDNNQKSITIFLTDRTFKLIKSYNATNFDCKPIKEDRIHYAYEHLVKSDKYADDAEIRKFYLRFMAKQFDTYEEDYYEHINNQARNDLGRTT